MNQPKNKQEEKEIEVKELDIIGSFDMSILGNEERSETGLQYIDITPESRILREARGKKYTEIEEDENQIG